MSQALLMSRGLSRGSTLGRTATSKSETATPESAPRATLSYVPPRHVSDFLGNVVTELRRMSPQDRSWTIRRITGTFPSEVGSAMTERCVLPLPICSLIGSFSLLQDWENLARAFGIGPAVSCPRKVETRNGKQIVELTGEPGQVPSRSLRDEMMWPEDEDTLYVSEDNVDELRNWQWSNLSVSLSNFDVVSPSAGILSHFMEAARIGVRTLDLGCWCFAMEFRRKHRLEEFLFRNWRSFPQVRNAKLRVCGGDCHLLLRIELPEVIELEVAAVPEKPDVRPALLALMARCPRLSDLRLLLENAICQKVPICGAVSYLQTPAIQALRSFGWLRTCRPRNCKGFEDLGVFESKRAPRPGIFRRRMHISIEGYVGHAGSRALGGRWRTLLLRLSDARAVEAFTSRRTRNILPFLFGSRAYWGVEMIFISLHEGPKDLIADAKAIHPDRELLLAVRPGDGGELFRPHDAPGPEISVLTVLARDEGQRAQLVWQQKSPTAPEDLEQIAESLESILFETFDQSVRYDATMLCIIDPETVEIRRRYSARHLTDIANLPAMDPQLRLRRWQCPNWCVGFNPSLVKEDPRLFDKDIDFFRTLAL